MREEIILEKIVCYENQDEIKKIIENNINQKFFLVRHSTSEKKLFFKNFNTPNKKIVSDT